MTAPSDAARRLWEALHDVSSNERAWEIIERAFDEVRKEQREEDRLEMRERMERWGAW